MIKTVQFKGKVKFQLREIDHGLRSSLSYVGAKNLDEFKNKCVFQHITANGAIESKF